MNTKYYKIPEYKLNYNLNKLGNTEDILFLDIETTGLSAQTSSIYLLGCCFYENNEWCIKQWLCESVSEEEDLLNAFIHFIQKYKLLIHFNGNQFDLPFIEKRCEKHGLDFSFKNYQGIDLYKRVYPYRHFLHLSNCKQKTLEQFMGIDREDKYSGGELISVFKSFCQNKNTEAKALLLQHNRDDVYGMLRLLPVLSYVDFFNEDKSINQVEINTSKDVFGKPIKEAFIYFTLQTPLPKPIASHGNDCYFTGKGKNGLLKIPIYTEEMKYFYSDYKNYYYLPSEDMSIHKSVATYVDPEFRKQATAATCYTRKQADYLPQWELIFEPFFKREYESKNLFFELTDEFKNNREAFAKYIQHILLMLTSIQ